MSHPTDRHGLEVLGMTQCLSLLRSRPLGRLAYVAAGDPVVVPVNHLVDGTTVVIRSLAGGKLEAALTGRRVAFQLDEHDPARGTGWSVLVQGTGEVIDDGSLIDRYDDQLDSWAVGDSHEISWLRIVPDEIAGRRLRRR